MASEVVKFADGRQGRFWTTVGTVVGSQVWSETHVSSSGGGGYVGKDGGQVHAPTVYSTAYERTRYWLRYEDGKETQIDNGISARDGHRILRLFGAVGGGLGELVAQVNLTTDQTLTRVPTGVFRAAYLGPRVYGFGSRMWGAWLAFVCIDGWISFGVDDVDPTFPALFWLTLFLFPIVAGFIRSSRGGECQREMIAAIDAAVARIREDRARKQAAPSTAA